MDKIESALKTLANIFGADRYSQHALCLTNDKILLTLYTASDLTIFASYIAIGISLGLKRHFIAELNAPALTMFGAFIFLCGLNHLTMVLTLYTGVYLLDITVKAATAGVSVVTAVYTVLSLWGDRDATSQQ